MTQVKKIGLSLSGGGYRAAAFHLGTMTKLNELRILDHVSVISAVSGGSILAAYYALHTEDFPIFQKTIYEKLGQSNVILTVLCSKSTMLAAALFLTILITACFFFLHAIAVYGILIIIALLIVIWKFQFTIFPISQEIEKAYDKIFFG